jgi:hypothetical protein
MPIGMDGTGLAHALRTDAQGRLELVLAGGGAYLQMLRYELSGTLTVGAGALRYTNRNGAARTLREVHLAVNTAPAGAALIVDVNLDGVSIFSSAANRPQIAAGAYAGASVLIGTTAWAVDARLTVDVDQVGSSTPGADLVVTVVYG